VLQFWEVCLKHFHNHILLLRLTSISLRNFRTTHHDRAMYNSPWDVVILPLIVLEAIKQDTSARPLPNHPVFSTLMASDSSTVQQLNAAFSTNTNCLAHRILILVTCRPRLHTFKLSQPTHLCTQEENSQQTRSTVTAIPTLTAQKLRRYRP
jgi:hypothetical protein